MLKRWIREHASDPSCSYCGKLGMDDDPIAAALDDFMCCFMIGVRLRYARADDEAVRFEDGEYVGAALSS